MLFRSQAVIATTEIYTLSLHDALPISCARRRRDRRRTASDTARIVEMPETPGRRLQDLAVGLRRTDLCAVQGTTARLILHGADERDIAAVLDRLGLDGVAFSVASATGDDLLVGPTPGGDPDSAPRTELASTVTEPLT